MPSKPKMITRFAPSPTGYLHVGHAMAAAQAFNYAKAENGTCLLRIEDIDAVRCKPEFTAATYEDLAWMGCKWPEPVRVQSEHLDEYARTIEKLKDMGLLYPCFKSRREIAAILDDQNESVYRGPETVGETASSLDETQSRIASGDVPNWRLSMAKARDLMGAKFAGLFYMELGDNSLQPANPWRYGDEVIARRDIGVSYHIACVHDDAVQNITHVIRGDDFSQITGFQVMLHSLLGQPIPLFFHHDLIADDEGKKLSKSRGDVSMRSLRESGKSAQEVLDMAFVVLER